MSVESPAPIVAMKKINKAIKIIGLRPNLSETGPYMICPIAFPVNIAVKENSIDPILTFNPFAIEGTMGRNVSIDIGPIMVKNPRIKA
jgi:hypothetical protein